MTPVIDRVRSLLSLARGTHSPGEADNAAAQAQKLITQHAIDVTMLNVGQDADESAEITVNLLHRHAAKQMPTWKSRLARVICEVNQCHSFRHGNELRVIGRVDSVAVIRCLFDHLVCHVDRVADDSYHQHGVSPRTWKNNFRLGCVNMLSDRIRKADKEARAHTRFETSLGSNRSALAALDTALSILDRRREQAVQYGREKLNLHKGKRRGALYNDAAWTAGKSAGKKIALF